MLGRLVAKLMLKACVPLVAVAGVMSYGVYLKGGDPVKLWQHVGGGAFSEAAGLFAQANRDASTIAGGLTGRVISTSGSSGLSGKTQVYTWKDIQGVTHFGTTAPQGVHAQTVFVDPNVNVLAPLPSSAKAQPDSSESYGLDSAPLQISDTFSVSGSGVHVPIRQK